jgi:ribonucleoside-diphosphate reductase alpha chain
VQYIAPDKPFTPAWEIPSKLLSEYYGIFQDFADQGISADYFITPSKFEGGKVPLSLLVTDWLEHDRQGNKSMYYQNTNDSTGGVFQVEEEKGCDGGSCTL